MVSEVLALKVRAEALEPSETSVWDSPPPCCRASTREIQEGLHGITYSPLILKILLFVKYALVWGKSG